MIPNLQRLKLGILLCLLFAMSGAYAAAPKPGDTAPGFSLKTLTGSTVSLAQLTQQGPVMLVFYETQCVYCFAHIGEFNALHDKYHRKGLSIVAINYTGEYITDIKAYARDNGLKYTVITDKLPSIDVAEAYHVVGSPTIVVVDSNGKIVFYGYTLPPDITRWLKS
ncbi:MAG: redoxin domain-containing protein [Gammaproteobacteria bacterium]|nr:redoxin domain-containing protein [Gammaproteobacteria bacterium]